MTHTPDLRYQATEFDAIYEEPMNMESWTLAYRKLAVMTLVSAIVLFVIGKLSLTSYLCVRFAVRPENQAAIHASPVLLGTACFAAFLTVLFLRVSHWDPSTSYNDHP